ncbi:hypothetical protein DSLASN_48680 [Desulfoluna limicola]|uniref:Co-chaperone DjlA N-terminal domain-containing protein n=1 Tax=Desulfoluna limicola TaxID=2810562 RepID=A0ABM7PPA7_9BACT|nr:TerB family tellurite resistance protein [Desulfoluna limicola]BCS99236.1 hypothetical protein DSLASN_48680 [Desulfoluna limicola]
MNVLWGRRDSYRYRARGEFYCPGCRQTVGCLAVETVRVTRILFLPVYRQVGDSGKVKCPICGGVFERQVTAFSPAVSREGLKPALVTVMLLMMDVDEGENRVEMAVISRVVAEMTGSAMGPEVIEREAERLRSDVDALGNQLAAIAPYLTNAEKRMILESAWRVAHADGHAPEKEMALMRQVALLLEVPDSIYRRVTGDTERDGLSPGV